MSRHFNPGRFLLILLIAFTVASSLQAQEFGESILIEQPVSRDLYLAGRDIDVLADVNGDVVAAGRRVTIAGWVDEDVIAAGENVTIQGSLQDDLRAAGKTVNLTGDVSGHVVLAGQTVTIGSEAVVGDFAWLAGESIDISGRVNGDVKAAGRSILIEGEIQGNVELTGKDLRIGPHGIIHGDLTWRSPNPLDQSSSARIDGRVIERPDSGDRDEDHDGDTGSFLFTVLSMALGAIVLYLLFQGYSKQVVGLIQAKPWTCLGSGLAILLITPFFILLMFITIIGILPGLALLATYFAFLIIGLLMGIIAVGVYGLRQTKKDGAGRSIWVLAILLAAVVTVLAWQIPFIGNLCFMLVWIFGLGSTGLGLVRRTNQLA